MILAATIQSKKYVMNAPFGVVCFGCFLK